MKTVGRSRQEIPLSRVVTIPPKAYPSTNIEHDDITLLENYLPGASTLEIVDRFSAGLRGAKSGRMLSITGPYGSGKSTLAAFLSGLLAAKGSGEWKAARRVLKNEPESYARTLAYARKKAGVHETGMIRCAATARREPISATILRALHSGVSAHPGGAARSPPARLLGRYAAGLKSGRIPDSSEIVKLVEDVARLCPTVIMIDEFGKAIEYFTADESQRSDLFLLQELAEMSGKGRRIPLSIVTLQHMAFEEYAVGASQAQKREWAKIQGRFEDIPFSNSPEQTRLLVSNTVKLTGDAGLRREVMRWAKRECRVLEGMGIGTGFDPALVASCYPLEPLALEVLPELCSRYGQHERTLLSFISDARKHTVATFIDEHRWDPISPPTIGIDALYDYFISGTSRIHSSSASISRLMEVETIIRDAHGLGTLEKKTLKAIGVLNLIGRSGYLRASRRMLDCAVREDAGQALERLKEKSIVTYREHADEYRIWHGTDINMAAKLDTYRKRCKRAPLPGLLRDTISLGPVVAAKHGIETGTMRLFERRFDLGPGYVQGGDYDGVILYAEGDPTPQTGKKPVITVTAGSTEELRSAAIEVAAIRDILHSDDEVTADWVARGELEERLADAEAELDARFADAYGESARWSHQTRRRPKRLDGTPSMMASKVCSTEYKHTPVIRNEMINRTVLSAQGSTAKKRLLEAMITRPTEPKFGIEGYGPERAIYEALLFENGIHVPARDLRWRFAAPRKTGMRMVWDAMLRKIKGTRGRISLAEVYSVAKMPPYGVRDGPLQIILVAMILAHRDSIALYEHGTFVPKLRPEEAERMTKNPEHFELKYFKRTGRATALLAQVASDLDVKPGESILDVVGHMVRAVSALPPHIKSTKIIDRNAMSVRDAILEAREPDTLLFESLPAALGYGARMSGKDITRFSRTLARSVQKLQNGLRDMLGGLCRMLFEATGIDNRADLSRAARAVESSVTDHGMKAFLTAVSADTLERENDWINYVAMSLTDVPPTDWNDDQRRMFGNRLRSMSDKFKRIAGMHFAGISGSFPEKSFHVSVTGADGTERQDVVSLDQEDEDRIGRIVSWLKKDMGKRELSRRDMMAILASMATLDPAGKTSGAGPRGKSKRR